MRRIFACAAVIALLGGCSDLNPFGGKDSPSADADKDKAAVADTTPAPPKRVVIARLENKPKADPASLDRLAPGARADDPAADPEPDSDETPKADEEFVNYLSGKKAPKRRTRRVTRAKKPAPKPKKLAADPNQFELDKIAPGAGPGRKTGQIDDAYSADRDFIKVLMTDSKPVRKRRARRVAKRRHVVARPSVRKKADDKKARKPHKARKIRIARRTKPAPKRPAKKTVAARRTKPAPKRTAKSLATIDRGEEADREVLKVLGGK